MEARWINVAIRAGDGVTPGHVCAVWTALLDHASQAEPRGSVADFEADTVADFFQWPHDVVVRVVRALTEARRIVDGRLAKWDKRQPKDPTGADRQARKRSRDRAPKPATSHMPEAAPTRPASGLSRDNHSGSRDGHTERGERESLSERQAFTSSDGITPNDPYLTARASAADAWAMLEQAGVPTGIIGRMRERTKVQAWIAEGFTRGQLIQAINRANKARTDQQDDRPINVGFVDSCLRNPRGERREHGFERGDSAVDTYLARSE